MYKVEQNRKTIKNSSLIGPEDLSSDNELGVASCLLKKNEEKKIKRETMKGGMNHTEEENLLVEKAIVEETKGLPSTFPT